MAVNTGHKTRQKNMKLPMVFILLVLVLDAMGIGLIMPVMPELLRDVRGGSLADAALWGGILSGSFAVMQFVFSPAMGSLSDRYGRRPVLIISLAVMAVDYLVMGFAWTIVVLLFARLVNGITAATQPTAAAFIADISKPEEKSANFGLMGAAFGVGFVLGPIIGGLLGQFGPRAPFFAAAGLTFASLIFGYIVLPETLTARNRRAFDWRRANPFGALSQISSLPGLGRFLLFYFFYEFAFMVYPAVWAFFTTARFGWSPAMIGASLASFGLAIAIVQGVLMRWILRKLGERGTVIFGLFFNMSALIVLGTITSGTLALILTPLTALGAVVTPAMQGMMSRRAADDQQGELQGVLASIRSVAMIFSPVAMTAVFSLFTADDRSLYLPGAPFYLAAMLVMICAAIALTAPRAQTTPAE